MTLSLLVLTMLGCATAPPIDAGPGPDAPVTGPSAAAPTAGGTAAGGTAGGGTAAIEMCDASGSDPVQIEGARLVGDRLELDLAHSGGCEAHRYQLCWSGALAESDPPQAMLEVKHDANGDMCEAWLTSTESFSLAPMGIPAGEPVVLQVGGKSLTWTP